jgi:hypothetical protein
LAHSADLPELATKQAIENLKFISKDGKYTYYYSQSGSLQFSTNYSFSIVHKAAKNTQFLLSTSDTESKILFEKIKNPHSQINFNRNNDIYLGSIGKSDFKQIAEGKSPKLHLRDTHVTYFSPVSNEIRFFNVKSGASEKAIKLINKINPYYTPTVEMVSLSDILYTDINSNGHEAILLHTTTSKKIKTLYKSRFPGSKLEFCLSGSKVYIGEFPTVNLEQSSQIVSIDLYNNENFQNIKTIYSSRLPDIGNMVCTGKFIAFVKTYHVSSELNSKSTDIVKLQMTTKKITRLTKNKNFTQLLHLSGSLIAPFGGKLFIVDGKNNLIDDSLTRDIK